MPYFVAAYDRELAKLIHFDEISGSIEAAAARRLSIELQSLRDGELLEVVLLQADSAEILHKTHLRYFEDLRTMLQDI